MTDSRPRSDVALRSLGATVYLPVLIHAVGQGAFAPVIVLSAYELGASLGTAGLVVALLGLGLIIGDLPAGALVGRIGERPAMILAAAIGGAGLLICATAGTILPYAAGVLVYGTSTATWGLARQVYVTDVVPYRLRARALSLLAGLTRIGMFIGPLAGAVAIGAFGIAGAYLVCLLATALSAVTLLALPDIASRPTERGGRPDGGTRRVILDNARTLRTLGLALVLVGIVRESRRVLIPLWGTFIALEPATISLIFALSTGADMLLFYPAGKIMDVAGRWWAAVPAFVILGVAHFLLPLVSTAGGLAVIAVLMGIGNGTSTGMVMTVGADVAPIVGRPQFLGAWRTLFDIGRGLGPLLISALIGVASIAAAAVAIGGTALLAAGALHIWVPKRLSEADLVSGSAEDG